MSAADRFSLAHLRELHRTLEQNKTVSKANASKVVEVLRLIAEMVVYGDSKSEMLFDFFCEKNMLSLFLELMSSESGCPIEVHVQILQTLGILINSVRNDTSLYYLLSNNYINEILLHPHDFTIDENLCEQYVSFIKSLSLKLDEQTVQFFFREETGAFPLLEKAITLLNYPEPMVRIAAQTAVLNIYRVRDSRSREYALKHEVLQSLFSQISTICREKFANILQMVDDHSVLVCAIDAINHGLDPTDTTFTLSNRRSSQHSQMSPLKQRGPKRMTPGRMAKAMRSLDSLKELAEELEEHDKEEGTAANSQQTTTSTDDIHVQVSSDVAANTATNGSANEMPLGALRASGSETIAIGIIDTDTNNSLQSHTQIPETDLSKNYDCTTPQHETFVDTPMLVQRTSSPQLTPLLKSRIQISSTISENRTRLKNIENSLVDAVSAADDWLYFLQDLLGLQIFTLRFGLVEYLLEHWLNPQILPLLVSVEDALTSSNRDVGAEMSVLDVKRGYLFLSQILRVVQDRLLQRAILIAVLHPCNMAEQAALLADCVVEESEAAYWTTVVSPARPPDVLPPPIKPDSPQVGKNSVIYSNIYRFITEKAIKYAMQPAPSPLFDVTTDHLAMSAGLLLHRVFENAISIGRYRELQSNEKRCYFTGISYELTLLYHLQLVPCGIQEGCPTYHSSQLLSPERVQQHNMSTNTPLESIVHNPAIESITLPQHTNANGVAVASKDETEAAKRDRLHYEELEQQRKKRNAKHTPKFGSQEITEGELDHYLDEYESSAEFLLRSPSPELLHSTNSSNTNNTSSKNSSLSRYNVSALLSLPALAKISERLKSHCKEGNLEISFMQRLTQQLELHARGPLSPTAPENTPAPQNLSLLTLQTFCHIIFAYGRLLHLTQTQLEDVIESEQRNKSQSLDNEEGAQSDGAAEEGEAFKTLKSSEGGDNSIATQRLMSSPAEDPMNNNLSSAVNAHLLVVQPQLCNELAICLSNIQTAYQISAQGLLMEIGNITPDLPPDNSPVFASADLPQSARDAMADKLLQYFSEEIDRTRNASYSRVAGKIISTAALYLNSTPELIRRVGEDYQGWPSTSTSGECFRRRVQLFLMLRYLYIRFESFHNYAKQCVSDSGLGAVNKLPLDSSASAPAIKIRPRVGADDLFYGITADSDFSSFVPLGNENNADTTYATGKLLTLKGRRFLEAESSYHRPMQFDTPDAKSRSSSTGTPKSNILSPPAASRSWASFGSFFGFGNSSNTNTTPVKSPLPASETSITPAKRLGSTPQPTTPASTMLHTCDILFVQHQQLLVLVDNTPKSLTDENRPRKVLIAVPLLNTEVCIVAPRKLRILIKSYKSSMENVEIVSNGALQVESTSGQNMHGTSRGSSDTTVFRSIFANSYEEETSYFERSEASMVPSLLQSRPTIHVYQTTLTFENEKICNLAAFHVQSRVRALRHAKHVALRALLSQASTSSQSL